VRVCPSLRKSQGINSIARRELSTEWEDFRIRDVPQVTAIHVRRNFELNKTFVMRDSVTRTRAAQVEVAGIP